MDKTQVERAVEEAASGAFALRLNEGRLPAQLGGWALERLAPAAQAGGGERAGRAALPRADRRRVARGQAEHRRAEAQACRTPSSSSRRELADLQRQQAQLSDKLGPNHPDMVKLSSAIRAAESKIQGEIAKVVQVMRNDYQQSQAQEQSLTHALDQQKSDALALNRKGIEYGVLPEHS